MKEQGGREGSKEKGGYLTKHTDKGFSLLTDH